MNDVALFKQFQASPLFFIEKMWGLTPQRSKEESFEKGKNVTWQQYEILLAVERALRGDAPRRISVASGHGIGKSATDAWLILWYLFCHKDAQVPCTAPTSEQMHDVLWKEVALWLGRMPKPVAELYEWSNGYIRVKERPMTWFARAKTARKENPEALAGVHGDYVMFVIDEASGVPEEIYTTAEGSLTGPNVLVVMISNPTRTMGYFFDSHHRDKANWQRFLFSCLDSPLVDMDYVDRIKDKHGEESDEYRIRVLGQFPREDAIDEAGYVPLLNAESIRQTAMDDFIGDKLLGVDPAGDGKDKTTWVVRDEFRAKIVSSEAVSDRNSICKKTLTLMNYYDIKEDDVFVDNFGVGANVVSDLAYMGVRVNGVNVGEKPNDEERFLNLRAEAYWRVREAVLGGFELFTNENWKELLTIRYRRELSGKLSIMPKKEMRKRGYKSPDHADALMLTYTRKMKRIDIKNLKLSY